MDMLLIAVTLVSLVVAVAMGGVAWRATREARLRAEARVAALAAAAGVPAPTPATEMPVPGTAAWKSPTPAGDHPGDLAAVPVDAGATGVTVPSGFLATDAAAVDARGPQRALAAAAAVLAVLLSGVIYARMSSQPTAPGAATTVAAPLELLSLRHEREGSHLSVIGLVRNPPAAATIERITAVVLLFDQQGAFVSSAQAPLDFQRLTAGDESPFVIKVSAPQAVARYRVSFRAPGGTLPHVDRRNLAAETAPAALNR